MNNFELFLNERLKTLYANRETNQKNIDECLKNLNILQVELIRTDASIKEIEDILKINSNVDKNGECNDTKDNS